jgi:hypothetical protein
MHVKSPDVLVKHLAGCCPPSKVPYLGFSGDAMEQLKLKIVAVLLLLLACMAVPLRVLHGFQYQMYVELCI